MLGLLGCATLAELFQPAVIRQGFANVFSKVERSYSDSPMKSIGQIWLFIFRIGVVSMAVNLFVYQGGTFEFRHYLTIAGALTGIELLKYLSFLLLNYTFQFSRQFSTLFAHYTYVNTTISCVLYPLLLLIIYIEIPLFTVICLYGIAIVFLVMLLVKLLRVFAKDMLSCFYILLYILTIEVLPFLTIIVLFS